MAQPHAYTSRALYHFVGHADPSNNETNYAVLSKVLKSGWISHHPHKQEWGGERLKYNPNSDLSDGELIIPDVVCFCDIPYEGLALHLNKYGPFGLSLSREYLVKYGARPVMYFPAFPSPGSAYGATRLADIAASYKSLWNNLSQGEMDSARTMGREDATLQRAASHAQTILGRDFLAFVKVFDPRLLEDDEKNYYMEREWRRLGNVKIDPEHVGEVLVEASFINRARTEHPRYSAKIRPSPVPPSGSSIESTA